MIDIISRGFGSPSFQNSFSLRTRSEEELDKIMGIFFKIHSENTELSLDVEENKDRFGAISKIIISSDKSYLIPFLLKMKIFRAEFKEFAEDFYEDYKWIKSRSLGFREEPYESAVFILRGLGVCRARELWLWFLPRPRIFVFSDLEY